VHIRMMGFAVIMVNIWVSYVNTFSYLIFEGHRRLWITNCMEDCAIAQVVGGQIVSTETQDQSQHSPCVICGRRMGRVVTFSSSTSGFPCQLSFD
jgi:hypothetical protein